MDEKDQMDSLDRQLREAAPYIDDEGFTRRVLQQLPARQPRPQAFRAMVLLGVTLLASVIAYVLSDGARFVSTGLLKVAAWSPLALLMLTLGTGILGTALGVVAAISKSQELQS
jgi:hypothetical protein